MTKALTALLAAVLLLSVSACRDSRGDERSGNGNDKSQQTDTLQGTRPE